MAREDPRERRRRGDASGPRRSTRPGRRPGTPRPRASAPEEQARPRFTSRAVVLLLVVAVLVVSYASSMRAYLEQRRHIDNMRASIASSQQSIAELERERQRWRDDAYVEARARQRFGWVMPGETSYQVIGADGEPVDSGGDDSLSDPSARLQETPHAWWQTAWGSMEKAGHPNAGPTPARRIQVPRGHHQHR